MTDRPLEHGKDYGFSDVLMHVDSVGFTYPGAKEPTLRNVNFAIHDIWQLGHVRGQIEGLLGPSGSGKTTLFRIMSGLEQPTVGRVVLNGNDTPVKVGEVGVVSQSSNLFRHRTVLQNLVIAGKLRGWSEEESTEEAHRLIKTFGLMGHEEKFPKQLSGGQRRRVSVGQQLMRGHPFILMDEPFTGIDPPRKEQTASLVMEVANLKEENTIVVVTHDVRTILTIADTIRLMGHDRDEEGKQIPGAKIMQEYNLVDMGLAWKPDIKHSPEFRDFADHLEAEFNKL